MHPIIALAPAGLPDALILLAGIAGLASAGILMASRPRERELRDSFGLFALAAAMMAAGFLLTGTGGLPASAAGSMLPDLLVAGATVVVWRACARLAGQPVRPVLAGAALGVLAALLAPPVALDAGPAIRQLPGSVCSLAFLGLALGELLRAPRRGDAAALRLAIGTLSALCLLLALRIVALAGPVIDPAATATAAAGAAFGWPALAYPLAPFLLAFVPLVVANARLAAESARQGGPAEGGTGLLPRRQLVERAMAMLAELPDGACLAVLTVRLNDLERIDSLHHDGAGNQALRHAAALLGNLLREDSLAARYDDDSFCALVPVASEASAFIVGERLRLALASTPCPDIDPPLLLDASVGVSVHRHGQSLRERLAVAGRRAQRPRTGRNLAIDDRSTL